MGASVGRHVSFADLSHMLSCNIIAFWLQVNKNNKEKQKL